jgi:hypothetical protein
MMTDTVWALRTLCTTFCYTSPNQLFCSSDYESVNMAAASALADEMHLDCLLHWTVATWRIA